MSAVIAYFHSLSMIALASLLFAQLLAFNTLQDRQGLHRFMLFSTVLVVSAAIALASGIALLIWTGHGSAFYLRNPVFYIKLAIFAAMLLVAITPARIIIQWHRDAGFDQAMTGEAETGALPEAGLVLLVRRYFIVELILLLVIPLVASLAARGIGLQLSAS